MYVTSRNLRVSSAAVMPQAVNLVNYAIGLLNENHGGQFGAAVEVAGDPSVIGILGRYETLGDFERMFSEIATDTEFQAAVQLGDHMFGESVADTLWNVRIPPGEPLTYSTVTSTNVILTRVNDAMAFAAEVAATVSNITGSAVGLATAATGNQSRIVWVGYNESLADMDSQTANLESDESYLDLFKRSDGLLAPNSLERTIWRSTAT